MSTQARGGDFAGDDRGAGLHHRFAGHAGALVLRQDRVEDGVGDLVGDLVRVAFGDGFGGEEVAAHRKGISFDSDERMEARMIHGRARPCILNPQVLPLR